MFAHPGGLIVERLGDETLIYNPATDHAHTLDPAAAVIWGSAAVATDAAAIAASSGLPLATVEDTLADLADRGLLVARSSGHTRREHLRTAALTGAALAATTPVIRSIVAPTAAQASTLGPPGAPCTTGAQCQLGVCNPVSNTCA